jgi:hypothetical protein
MWILCDKLLDADFSNSLRGFDFVFFITQNGGQNFGAQKTFCVTGSKGALAPFPPMRMRPAHHFLQIL